MADERNDSPIRHADASDVMSMHVDELDLSVRSHNCLRNEGITRVAELVEKTPEDLLDIRNMGITSVRDIERTLRNLGLRLSMSAEDVSEVQNVDPSSRARELDAFIETMNILSGNDIRATDAADMTSDEILAVLGLDRDALAVLENGLERWGLHIGNVQNFGAGTSDKRSSEIESVVEREDDEKPGEIICFQQSGTFKDDLIEAVTRLAADRRSASSKVFLAKYGIDGDRTRTLQEIGDEGERHGFDRPVTRERVRQVLQSTEDWLRRNAHRVRLVRWEAEVERTRRYLPVSVQVFALRFGYEDAQVPEDVFKMLRLCTEVFGLTFPFELRAFHGLVVDPDDDASLVLVRRLQEVAAGCSYSELAKVVGQIGCEEDSLSGIIDASSRLEFLDDERKYFWRRPCLPPENYRVTGNAILSILCKIFSVARRVATSDLTRSIPRNRWLLRKIGGVSELPDAVLEGIAERSELFDVDRGQIKRKHELKWWTIGTRDIELIRICLENDGIVSSGELHLGLLRSGLARENARILVATSPFLAHTRSGRFMRQGVYKFVVKPEDVDLDALKEHLQKKTVRDPPVEESSTGTRPSGEVSRFARTKPVDTSTGEVADEDLATVDAGAEEVDTNTGKVGDADTSGYDPASDACLRIPVSSRVKLSGRFFAPGPLGLDGQWNVRGPDGADIVEVIVSGRTVSGLRPVVAALGLERGNVLELRPDGEGTLVASS